MSENLNYVELLVQELYDLGEVEVDLATEGLGLKAHMSELFSDKVDDGSIERLLLQFYVSCVVPLAPSDVNQGYQNIDVVCQRGVVLADVEEATNPPRYIGKMMTVDDFIEQYIRDEHTLQLINVMFDTIYENAFPKDKWLDRATTMYHERIPGMTWITNIPSMC